MDERFLIYQGFKEDAELIFQNLLDRYGFDISSKSDWGITLENEKVTIELSYETGLQIWIKNKIDNVSLMLFDIAKEKGLQNTYFQIVGEHFFRDRKKALMELSDFMGKNFLQEFTDA